MKQAFSGATWTDKFSIQKNHRQHAIFHFANMRLVSSQIEQQRNARIVFIDAAENAIRLYFLKRILQVIDLEGNHATGRLSPTVFIGHDIATANVIESIRAAIDGDFLRSASI